MTTIAYRDGIMAADTKISTEELYFADMPCIRKVQDMLIGACGNVDLVEWFLRTWNRDSLNNINIDHPVAKLEGEKDQHFEALVVTPESAYYITPKLIATKVDAKYLALGSGQLIAYGAMYMGANAAKAVEAAITHDHNTGGKIQTISLAKVKGKSCQ